MLRAPFLLLISALLVVGISFTGPASAQNQLCDTLETVFSDLINNKLRKINTRKKDSRGDWIARVNLPDMDSCRVETDPDLFYICEKQVADASELDAMFVKWERAIGECYSGFKVTRDSHRMGDRVSWSPGRMYSINLSRTPVMKLLRISISGF